MERREVIGGGSRIKFSSNFSLYIEVNLFKSFSLLAYMYITFFTSQLYSSELLKALPILDFIDHK